MPDPDDRREQHAGAPVPPTCPVMSAADLVGDRWTLLILRDAFNGIRRFSQFQRSLGIARNILSARLSSLVAAGILHTEPGADGTSYSAYALTHKGIELFDLIVALRQWGERHLIDDGTVYRPLLDIRTGAPLPRVTYMRPDGTPLHHSETRLGEPRPMATEEPSSI
ncbi:winged helix-turn-helix transcriptional regulator [Microtetraspora fusca]|uniref:winged helix-turn-helix transcriptional regulator n=1 Tax=Microtetraspora fusca TaxID=1997 RepID=UPI000836BA7B|nr:helix-turn-helix domain-containing protein [Microtetraspora fusca]